MSFLSAVRLSLLPAALLVAVNAHAASDSAKKTPPAAPMPGFAFESSKEGMVDDFAKGASQAEKTERFHTLMLKKYDKDGDGKLSPSEEQALRQDMYVRYQFLLKKYDKNKNGVLDPDEVAAMEADLAKRRAIFMKNFDKDHDGKLNEQEAAAMRAELEKRRANYLDAFGRSAF